MVKLSLVIFLIFLLSRSITFEKMRGLDFDGASTMSGNSTGVSDTPEVACTKRSLLTLSLPSTATGCCRTCTGKASLRYTINNLESILLYT